MKQEVSICWFRRDLRLEDNTGLFYALQSPYPVLPIFIFDPEILGKLSEKADRRVSFIHLKLNELNEQCHQYGSSLYVIYAEVTEAFNKVCNEFDVKAVFCNHDYEPYAVDRDRKVESVLKSKGITFHTYKDQVLFERSEIVKSDGSPYTVFTPYSKQWRRRYDETNFQHLPSEERLTNLVTIGKLNLPSMNDLGFVDIDPAYPAFDLSESTIRNYEQTRNLPAINGTSQISPYLRFGIISIRHLVKLAHKWNERWLNELIWREFFMMILYHFPYVINQSFKKKYDQIPWRNNEDEFAHWCKGETGYPIVDAGMRQLNETGLMHNRVRMIVAGFLTKHLLIDWRWGESYFAQKLLDYELSSNNGNWQWAAGSGCDSAPYFRIFNPTTQTQKFDPKLVYIKTWIKEFNRYHLSPIVEHEFARKRALHVYKTALNE